MEGVMVSAATGALKAVAVKLAALLGDEFKHMKDVRKEIKPLSDELNCIHAFLKKMSEEENPDDQDKIWMTDVREMSYDIEDSLDDFMIYLGDDKSAKPKGVIKKCEELLTKIKARKRISKAIQEFKTQVKDVGDRNQRYRTGVVKTKDTGEMVDTRALVIFNEASELVGIDKSKNELISMLTKDGSSSQHEVKVISVVGCGGLGKTTLAKQVYDSLKDRFDCQAFVTVSRNPDMMKLLRTILSDISRQNYTDTEAGDVQHLVEKISNFLQDKSFGSRILTTTRISEAAESCCFSHRGHIYKLCPLNDVDSRGLFLKRIFGRGVECPSHLTKVCDNILKKCDGLPLAIISIAGLLAGKARTFDEWNKVQSSFGYGLERQSDVNKMIQILSLSYFDLPPQLRSCLLYLSIFPEDHWIRKDGLILRWIAEGFIHEEHGFTQYELGERCFNELINRSLIQPSSFDLLRSVIGCQVHDTILEFIVSKAVEENFVTLFGVPNAASCLRRKIRRLSLQDRNEIGDTLVGQQENIIYSHARTVSVFPGSLGGLPSLLEFRHVRVLDLEGCGALQAHHLAHLGDLFTLRYLSLRDTEIHELPIEIGELQFLQTLDIRANDINELPSSVVCLARLVNLLCGEDLRLPDGFGNMQALQRLSIIGLRSQSPSFVQELRQLRNLRKLELYIEEFTKHLVSSLCTLGTAGSLNYLIMHVSEEAAVDIVMEPWSPTPLCLKILEIWGPYVPMVPRWIGSLDNLRHLCLNVVQLGPADIVLLGGLHALSRLSLSVDIEVADRSSSQETQRVKISGAHGFPSLRMLRIGSYKCAFGLLFEAGAMPKLQELNFKFDRDKTSSHKWRV